MKKIYAVLILVSLGFSSGNWIAASASNNGESTFEATLNTVDDTAKK